MIKDLLIHLSLACAPNVAPETIDQIVKVESSYNEFAINVNLFKGQPYPSFQQPTDLISAVSIVQDALSKGHSIDIGLMQINTNNLDFLGLSIIETFDPCINVAAGGALLTGFYKRSVAKMGEGQQALLSALSMYNTGSPIKGFTNGYIDLFLKNARYQTAIIEQPDFDNPIYLKALNADTSVPIPIDMYQEGILPEENKTSSNKTPKQDETVDNSTESISAPIEQGVRNKVNTTNKESTMKKETEEFHETPIYIDGKTNDH